MVSTKSSNNDSETTYTFDRVLIIIDSSLIIHHVVGRIVNYLIRISAVAIYKCIQVLCGIVEWKRLCGILTGTGLLMEPNHVPGDGDGQSGDAVLFCS